MSGYHQCKLPTTKLSPRQLQILDLAAHGLSDREIATQMGMGCETVKTHNAIIRERLKAKNKTESVAIGIRRALI